MLNWVDKAVMTKNRNPRQRKVRIAPARYGRGVYAQRRFKAEEVIGRIRGDIVADPSLDQHYTMEMDNDLYLVPKAPFRYVNHSCNPNCELFMWEEDPEDETLGSRPLLIAARRAIRPGEQLTIDYAWPSDIAIPCVCRSSKCRGWIVDQDDLPDLG